jgi:hypothetical protein
VAGVLSAAAATLDEAQKGNLTFAYATASFIDYHDKVANVGDSLASLGGAPPSAEVTYLQQLMQAAKPVLESPCVHIGCDWQGQVDVLQRAADGFDQAAQDATEQAASQAPTSHTPSSEAPTSHTPSTEAPSSEALR